MSLFGYQSPQKPVDDILLLTPLCFLTCREFGKNISSECHIPGRKIQNGGSRDLLMHSEANTSISINNVAKNKRRFGIYIKLWFRMKLCFFWNIHF